ncbi:MAG: hypothetical protein IT236_10595, partial [Bacteroidia bacterium]|nr:hypothetical protein [Bacteroidia bacterium]
MNSFLNQLPVFEANQVLTSSQLNSMVDYLDQQNRITRVNLIGTGIACGLEVRKNATDTELTITKGMGITSNGYLISLGEDRPATKYRTYFLPQGTRYIPFENNSGVVDVTLYELLTEDVTIFPSDTPVTLDSTFLSNKVVLLFLEVVDVDLQSCLGKACDEHGKQRSFNLRKLLISKTDMNKINGRIHTQTVPYEEKFGLSSGTNLPLLPELFMRKPVFVFGADPNDPLICYTDFSNGFVNSLNSPVKPTSLSISPDPELQDLSLYPPKIFEVIEATYT